MGSSFSLMAVARQLCTQSLHGYCLANKAVILASGGFARNASLVRKYLPATANSWTVSPRGNQGDGIGIGVARRSENAFRLQCFIAEGAD